MADKLTAVAIAEGTDVSQLPGLGDVVQEDAGDDQVAIEAGIKFADGVGHLDGVERVLQQAADEGVVEIHRGRRLAHLVHELLVVEIGLHERGQITVLNAVQQLAQPLAHLVDVFVGVGDEVGNFERAIFGGPALLDDELEIVLIVLDVAANFEKTGLGHGAENITGGVPHARGDLRSAVGQKSFDEVFAAGGCGELLASEDEDIFHHVARDAVAQIKSAHG